MDKRTKRAKIVPDKVFDLLWSDCDMSIDSYLDKYLGYSSPDRIDFSRFYMDDDMAYSMLKNIHKAYSLSVREIVSLSGANKYEIYHFFCIPRSTFSAWYSDTKGCAPYVRLMMIRHYGLLDLGKYVILESEYNERRSRLCVRQNRSRRKLSSLKIISRSVYDYSSSPSDLQIFSRGTKETLEKTDYLKRAIRSQLDRR